jgi:hypothetical protein
MDLDVHAGPDLDVGAIRHNLSDLIGNTPLLELHNYARRRDLPARIVAKLEYFNPAGSVKDRIAWAIIREAEAAGALKPGVITAARKNDGRGAHHTEHVANESVQEASREESRRPSITASLELPNGVHKDGIPEASGEDAVVGIGASADAPPVSQPGRSSSMNAYLAHLSETLEDD